MKRKRTRSRLIGLCLVLFFALNSSLYADGGSFHNTENYSVSWRLKDPTLVVLGDLEESFKASELSCKIYFPEGEDTELLKLRDWIALRLQDEEGYTIQSIVFPKSFFDLEEQKYFSSVWISRFEAERIKKANLEPISFSRAEEILHFEEKLLLRLHAASMEVLPSPEKGPSWYNPLAWFKGVKEKKDWKTLELSIRDRHLKRNRDYVRQLKYERDLEIRKREESLARARRTPVAVEERVTKPVSFEDTEAGFTLEFDQGDRVGNDELLGAVEDYGGRVEETAPIEPLPGAFTNADVEEVLAIIEESAPDAV